MFSRKVSGSSLGIGIVARILAARVDLLRLFGGFGLLFWLLLPEARVVIEILLIALHRGRELRFTHDADPLGVRPKGGRAELQHDLCLTLFIHVDRETVSFVHGPLG